MKLPISLFIIFLIVSPFAATADFTTFSAFDNNGNTFSATTSKIGNFTFTSGTTSEGDSFNSTQYNFDNDYDSDLDLDF